MTAVAPQYKNDVSVLGTSLINGSREDFWIFILIKQKVRI